MELWPSSIMEEELVFQAIAAGIALFEAVMLAFFVARVVWRKPFNVRLNLLAKENRNQD
jgi:hypothetical protein